MVRISRYKKFIIYLLILLNIHPVYAAVGTVKKAKGRVEIIKKGNFLGKPYKIYKGLLDVGDILRTKRKSYALVSFIDKSKAEIFENTRLWIRNYIPKNKLINLPLGKVIFEIQKQTKGKLKILTSTSIIGVKGTQFLVLSYPLYSFIFVKRGSVEVVNPKYPKRKVLVSSGKYTIVYADLPPTQPKNLNLDLKKKEKLNNLHENILKEDIISENVEQNVVDTELESKIEDYFVEEMNIIKENIIYNYLNTDTIFYYYNIYPLVPQTEALSISIELPEINSIPNE